MLTSHHPFIYNVVYSALAGGSRGSTPDRPGLRATCLQGTERESIVKKVKIITDSASDISPADEAAYGIEIIPFQVSLGERTYTSRVDFDNDGFYALMAQYDEIPKTAQVNPYQFQELYLDNARQGVTELILVLINSRGSATYGNSLLAKEQFFAEYPEYQGKIRIHSFDGRGYSAQYGAPVVEAARRLKDGGSVEAVLAYLEDILPRREVFFGMYTLKYAAKSGRIPSAAAFLGDKLNLKPVMQIFGNEIVTAAKCRGENKLVQKVAEMTAEAIQPGTPYETICGSDLDCARQLGELLTQMLGYPPAATYQIGAAVAANSGPKVVGASFARKG